MAAVDTPRASRIAAATWQTIPPPDGPWDDPVLEQLADTELSSIVDEPLMELLLTPEPIISWRGAR